MFAGATSLFGLVSSGLGLFNEAVLAERGFSQETYHTFLAATAVIALVGQFGCGWLTMRWPMQRLLGLAMFIYALALVALPFISTLTALWVFAALVGLSGGMITVIFFAIWRRFGSRHLGRIQGAAQMLTVRRVGHRAAALRAVRRDHRVVRADSLDPRAERLSHRTRGAARGGAGRTGLGAYLRFTIGNHAR